MTELLHPAQVSILSALRHTETARFTTLMRPTGLQSDTFKFHVRKLDKLGYIEKSDAGDYRLTPHGKEMANNLDETRRTLQRQPKLSMLVVVRELGAAAGAEPRYLFQRRLRNPFFGFWGCISGPVPWGEDAETAAAHELKKQTGITATCTVRAFYRKRDYLVGSDSLLEDKLFFVLEAHSAPAELANSWHGGHNAWMTVPEYTSKPHHFASSAQAIAMLAAGQTYTTQDAACSLAEY